MVLLLKLVSYKVIDVLAEWSSTSMVCVVRPFILEYGVFEYYSVIIAEEDNETTWIA